MGEQMLSSLPLEILLYFNQAFLAFFFVIEALCFIYKGNTFLYAPGTLGLEVFFLFAFVAIELARIFNASKGNKTEQIGPLVWSFVLAAGSTVIYVYYFQLQTYVLKVDRVLNGMGLAFIGLEGLLMILVALTFYRAKLRF